MRRLLLIQLALLLITGAVVAGSSSFASAGKKCVTIGEKRVCFEEGKNKKNDDDDDDDDDHKLKKKAGNKCEGEISCPAGYVVLDKPNKYGACCEPKEGLPAPASTEKCKFPGEVGTPPNCRCPDGTEFSGYKGCVKVEMKKKCVVYPTSGFTQDERNRLDKEWAQIRDNCPKNAGPAGCIGATCCCEYKVYAN
jgi:hypothetical protein